MSGHDSKSAHRPDPDALLVAIASYAHGAKIDSPTAYETARYCLMDSLACGLQALNYPACTRLLGPVVPGATLARRCTRAGHWISSSNRYRQPSTSAR